MTIVGKEQRDFAPQDERKDLNVNDEREVQGNDRLQDSISKKDEAHHDDLPPVNNNNNNVDSNSPHANDNKE